MWPLKESFGDGMLFNNPRLLSLTCLIECGRWGQKTCHALVKHRTVFQSRQLFLGPLSTICYSSNVLMGSATTSNLLASRPRIPVVSLRSSPCSSFQQTVFCSFQTVRFRARPSIAFVHWRILSVVTDQRTDGTLPDRSAVIENELGLTFSLNLSQSNS